MRRFKRILHITESGSRDRAALRRAMWLASNNKAKLTVGTVIDKLPDDLRSLAGVTSPHELEELAREDALLAMKRFARPSLKKADVDLEFTVLSGTPFVEIIREVLRNDHDLVIQTAEGEGGLRKLLFGTTTMHLMRKCPCPVWAVKSGRRRTYARVLAALALATDDAVAVDLNRKILELATSLAGLERGALHVVNAWSLYGESTLRGRARTPRHQINQLLRETRAQRESMLTALLEPFDLEELKGEVHLVKGQPQEVIPRIVCDKHIEIIVMGTLSRSGVAGLLIGNTAESVLTKVDCSVLAVKPEGFSTPIQMP